MLLARLLLLHRRGTLSWDREIGLVVTVPLVLLAVVAVSRVDEPVSRTDPLLIGGMSGLVLASLGAYALWLGDRYDSRLQRVLGRVSLSLAGIALVLTTLGAALRLIG